MTSATFPTAADRHALEHGATLSPRFDANGLIAAVATHADTGEVLMFAWMNAEALSLTLDTGEAHYFSRSRNELWTQAHQRPDPAGRRGPDRLRPGLRLAEGQTARRRRSLPYRRTLVLLPGHRGRPAGGQAVTVLQALLAFSVAAGLLTLTPGLDTALVLRAAAVEGPKRAGLAAIGIAGGCLAWGAAAALGLAALLQASAMAFTALKWAGAAYLVWLGLVMLLKPRKQFEVGTATAGGGALAWLRKGFFTNLLNPKVGVFYVSFLPQFLPQGVAPAPFIFLLACLHVAMGLAWFAALIAATQPIAAALKRPAVVRWLDRATGVVFLGFGLRLALERR